MPRRQAHPKASFVPAPERLRRKRTAPELPIESAQNEPGLQAHIENEGQNGKSVSQPISVSGADVLPRHELVLAIARKDDDVVATGGL